MGACFVAAQLAERGLGKTRGRLGQHKSAAKKEQKNGVATRADIGKYRHE
jgi:hypothetical protein